MEQIFGFLKPLIEAYAGGNGAVLQVVAIIGTLRIIIKPVYDCAKAIISATPTKKDDEVIAKVDASKFSKMFWYFLDWTGSIKLGTQKK